VRARAGPSRQLIGLNAFGDPALGARLASETLKSGYGGVMVYNLAKNSGPFLSQLSNVEFGRPVNIEPNCLR
jgi:hypothetical protein